MCALPLWNAPTSTQAPGFRIEGFGAGFIGSMFRIHSLGFIGQLSLDSPVHLRSLLDLGVPGSKLVT
jgi:hypothetical protein